jgi:hypothetical protein
MDSLDAKPKEYAERFTLAPIDILIIPISDKTDIYSWHFGDALQWERPNPGRDEPYYVEADSYREISYNPASKFFYRIAYRGVGFLDGDCN